MKLKHLLPKTIMFFSICILLLIGCKDKTSESNAPTNEYSTENSPVTIANTSWHQWTAPSQLSDLKITSVAHDPYAQMNLSSFSAVYVSDAKIFRINITDGSSEKGKSETSKHRKVASKNVNYESEYGHEKTIDYQDTKALQEYLASVNQYLITFLLKDKYGVSIKTEGLNAEETWQLIDALNLKQLE